MLGYRENEVDHYNSTNVALASGATFTGVARRAIYWNALLVSLKTDKEGTLFVDFSSNGSDWDSTISYEVNINVNEVHRVTITREYYRVRFTNNASTSQTFFRLTSINGSHTQLSAPLNQSIGNDADAIVVRAIDIETLIAQGLLTGYSIVNKFGNNVDIDTGSVPEDVWNYGGTYTGFASAAETLTVTSDSTADAAAGTGARTIRITGLDANYNQQSETVTLNGTTGVTTTNTFIRAHTATILSAGSGGVNAGTITITQSTTTANVMLSMIPGRNQTNVSAFTIPAGYTGYLTKLHGQIRGGTTATADGFIWTRSFGAPFRGRRPFTISASAPLMDTIYGGLVLTEKSDLVLRIDYVSAINTHVSAGYDLILVKNNLV